MIKNEKKILFLENYKKKLKLHREMVIIKYIEKYKEFRIEDFFCVIELPWKEEVEIAIEKWVTKKLDKFELGTQDWRFACEECLSV